MPEKTPNLSKVEISTGTIIKIILFGLLILSLYYVWDLVLVILTSIVIASFIESSTRSFTRWKINRTLAVLFLYFVGLGFFAVVFYLFLPLLIIELSNFLAFISPYLPHSSQLEFFKESILPTIQSAANGLQGFSLSDILNFSKGVLSGVSGVSGGFFQAITDIFGGLINFVFIIIISFYLSIQKNGIQNFLRIVVPLPYEDYAINLWERSEKKIALWVKGQFLLGLMVAVLTYLGLTLLRVDNALLLAVIAGTFELIPFGIYLAAVPAIAMAYTQGAVTLALLVTGLYIIIHQFEIYLVYPLVVKRVVGISPLIVILSILIGAKLAGVWGVILAIPVAVSLFEFLDDVEKKKLSAKIHEG
jgi:predicted PurR-regulated permease PerM